MSVSSAVAGFFIPSCENLSLCGALVSRVCEVTLHGDKTFTLRHHKFRVSEALKTGEATALFGTVHMSCLYYDRTDDSQIISQTRSMPF